MGTTCLSPPAAITIAVEKSSVATAELAVVTDGSVVATVEQFSTEALWS